jgi:hypothetical protein
MPAAALLAALALAAPGAGANDLQRGGTFVEPPANVPGIYLPAGPNLPSQADAPALRLSVRLALDVPLRGAGETAAGQGAQGSPPGSPTVQLGARWRPVAGEPWFVQANLLGYLRPRRQQPWNPDFTYGFGYEDFQPGRWSFVYANYSGTRLSPDRARGEGRSNFRQGTWSAVYRFALPGPLHEALLVGDGDASLCHASANHTPRYTTSGSPSLARGKRWFGLGCRYTRPEGWFAHLDVMAWPQRREQQPWDPDYTYGFGTRLPQLPQLVVQYTNYSGNRWPGRDRGAGQGQLRSGSVTVSWESAF